VTVSQTLKVPYKSARMTIRASYVREGSVIAGTARSYCEGFTTELQIESDEPRERVAQLIRMAEQTCFAMSVVRDPVPCELVAVVNGKPLDYAAG
jgi:hypothetical protein